MLKRFEAVRIIGMLYFTQKLMSEEEYRFLTEYVIGNGGGDVLREKTEAKYVSRLEVLPEHFSTKMFADALGFANTRSANKAINRLIKNGTIARVMRGFYQKQRR